MKRFSKIFCIALLAIVLIPSFSIFIAQATTGAALANFGEIPKECVEGAAAISASKLLGTAISGPPLNYCYSSSVTLIISLYKSLGYSFGGRNDRTVIQMNDQILSAVKSQPVDLKEGQASEFEKFKNAYEQFSSAPPKDDVFAENTNIKTLMSFGGTLKALIGTGVQSAVEEDLIATSGFANLNEGICDNIVKSSLIFNGGTWFKEVLALINCWIISLISKVVGWGVDLMSLLIEPGFWGGISINPAVTAGFAASIELVNIIFSVALVIMAIGTILNLKSYKINELITKFIIVALLINFTLVIAGSILDLANYLSLFFLNLTAKSAGGGIVTAWMGIFSGITNRVHDTGSTLGVLLITILINILLLIAMIWAFGSIIISLFKRGFMLIVLLIISPFAVVSSLLPGKGTDQWKKWKDAFLKYTFYGVYVTAGLYLGTVMLLSLCESLNTTALAAHPEMSFMSGLMVPIMAAGFLIFIVLQADELAGGSAKAAAEGASKLALSLAGGAALAGAMQAKNAVTTSEWYGKTAGALSTTKGLGWLGNAGLKTREDSLAYRNKQGEIIDADVNRRDISTNKTRLQAIANSKDPRLAREKAAIAKKLVADKQMDETSMALLGNNIGTIVNDENEKNGWVPKSLKKSLKDSLPSLFIRSDLEKATGLNESIITKALDDTKGNVIEAAKVLAANEHAKTNEGGMQKALEKYTDEKAKVLIQFNKNLENAKDESLVANLLDASEYTQKKVMEKLAQNPATMRTVLEQINGSGLSSEKKQAVTQLFQTYLDNNGGKFTEKQLHYVNENIPWLDTGMADDIVEQSKKRVPLRKAFNEAIIEDVEFEKQSQAKMENIIEKQRESARSSQAEQVYEAATKANAARDSLSKAIEWAKKTNSIAQTPESRKTLDTLVKKWNDTYGPNHK